MTAQPIVIVGTGGSGRETFALLRDIEADQPGTWDFKGFLGMDDPQGGLLERLGTPFLGDPRTLVDGFPEAASWAYALGIGTPQHRRSMDAALADQGLEPASLVHPSALIGPDVEIGPGAVICAQTVVTTNVRIGTSVQVNIGCVVAHDASTEPRRRSAFMTRPSWAGFPSIAVVFGRRGKVRPQCEKSG